MTDKRRLRRTAKGKSNPTPRMKYRLGFKFTEEEEGRMFLACLKAAKYMRDYGKGRKPQSIDREYYKYKPSKRHSEDAQ